MQHHQLNVLVKALLHYHGVKVRGKIVACDNFYNLQSFNVRKEDFVCGKVEPPWKFALFLLRTNNRHTQKILKELVLVEVQDHV